MANVNPADKATILSPRYFRSYNCTFFGLLTAILALVALLTAQRGGRRRPSTTSTRLSVSVLNLIVSNREKFKIRESSVRRAPAVDDDQGADPLS